MLVLREEHLELNTNDLDINEQNESLHNLHRKRLLLPLWVNVSHLKACCSYFIMENCYAIEVTLVSLDQMYTKNL